MTDNEGAFLALVLRTQPATAYQISRIYEESPVSNFNTSKGKIYPMIRRLEMQGLIEKRPVEGDARGAEVLLCTAAGRAAVKAWVQTIRPTHLLLEDPLRTKVQSLDLLDRDEQIAWIVDTKAALHDKLRVLDEYGRSVTVPFHEAVHDNAVSALRSRMDWLDRLLQRIVKGGNDQEKGGGPKSAARKRPPPQKRKLAEMKKSRPSTS
ncbi:PadR family transcriptional regulator [Sphingosinicella sp. LHD-64]|uniref:PadR family transcriptional regulator n=1 Tax=Sphingosinicella sp. LHD-64 TaxID=3072139 RepID=UPI00280FFC9B|nr:PadR family transcriptional regulator [Sphingosinicella sp. LHD-64]MDQ8757527.1 PadR family transcriptional regulator [Sphingosinicella sp. LHD-64]